MNADAGPLPEPATLLRGAAAAAVAPLYRATRLLHAEAERAERWWSEIDGALALAFASAVAALGRAELERAERALEQERALATVRAESARAAAAEGAAAFAAAITEVQRSRAELLRRYPSDVRAAAFALARAILDTEFRLRPAAIECLVERALKLARGKAELCVRLRSADLSLVAPRLAELAARAGLAEVPRLLADDDLPPRSVRVEVFGLAETGYSVEVERLFEDLARYVERSAGAVDDAERAAGRGAP